LSRGRGLFFCLVLSCLIFSVAGAKEIRYDKGNRREPFDPLIGPHAFRGSFEGGREAFPLQGIVYDPKEGSYVVIGGEIYREGESVNGARLIKVFPDRAILSQESNEIVIWLREEILEPGQKKPEKSEEKENKDEKK